MLPPRSQRAHDKVLQAALRLFSERGIDATSMDSIAELSGVSKATIYKHWPDKDALCLEVLGSLQQPLPETSAGDIRSCIVTLLKRQPAEHGSKVMARVLPHFVAYAARNPGFSSALRARVMEPSHSQLTTLLQRAVAEGELSAALDIHLAVALLLGPMFYRRAMGLIRIPQPADMAERVVDAFWRAFGTSSRDLGPDPPRAPRPSRRTSAART